MRIVQLLATTLAFMASVTTSAQGLTWSEYESRQDFFSVSFPGDPTIEEIIYPTEYRIELPGRVYSYDAGTSQYSMTVIDYNDAIDIHLARNDACFAAGGDGDLCQDDGPEEMRGAIVYASWNIMNRDGVDVTHYAHYNSDRVEGHSIRLTNADGSSTSAAVHMHENRLYILEATVQRGAPAAGLFQISVRFLDDQYRPVRYEWEDTRLYSNGYPPPARVFR